MGIVKFELRWVKRDQCLFDERRRGGGEMSWNAVVTRLTTNTGVEEITTAMATHSGQVMKSYLCDTVAPMVVGRPPYDRGKISCDFWNPDRHKTPFPVFLPGFVDVTLWDIYAEATGLPLYQYVSAYREGLSVYASSLFYGTVDAYANKVLYYRDKGIPFYRVRPPGPYEFNMEIHQKFREAVGPDMGLITDPIGRYSLDEVIMIDRHSEKFNHLQFEEPSRDFGLYKYRELCKTLDIPITATRTTCGAH